jgi:hypothetical protein
LGRESGRTVTDLSRALWVDQTDRAYPESVVLGMAEPGPESRSGSLSCVDRTSERGPNSGRRPRQVSMLISQSLECLLLAAPHLDRSPERGREVSSGPRQHRAFAAPVAAIGRIEKGFDFLGYRFGRIELTVARVTLKRFLGRVSRLSEQEQGTSSDDAGSVLGAYVRRWLGWLTGGAPRGLVSGCEREPESLHSACRVCRQSCYGTGGPLKIIVAR